MGLLSIIEKFDFRKKRAKALFLILVTTIFFSIRYLTTVPIDAVKLVTIAVCGGVLVALLSWIENKGKKKLLNLRKSSSKALLFTLAVTLYLSVEYLTTVPLNSRELKLIAVNTVVIAILLTILHYASIRKRKQVKEITPEQDLFLQKKSVIISFLFLSITILLAMKSLMNLPIEPLKISLLIISGTILVAILSWVNNQKREHISEIRKTFDLNKWRIKIILFIFLTTLYLSIEYLVTAPIKSSELIQTGLIALVLTGSSLWEANRIKKIQEKRKIRSSTRKA